MTEAEEWSHSTITGSICTLQAFPCLYLTESSTQLCCGCCSLFTGGENALRGETVLGSRCLQLSPALPWALMSEFKPATPAVRAELLDAPEAASNSGPHMLTHDLCFGVLHLHPSFEARLGLCRCQAPQLQSRDFSSTLRPHTSSLCDCGRVTEPLWASVASWPCT